MQLSVDVKICNTCHVEKPLTDFYRKRREKDGYDGRCKQRITDKNSQGWEWAKCACGRCEEYVKSIDSNGDPRRFVRGHYNNGKSKIILRLIPCKCNCGEILLNRNDQGKKREYIHGHQIRGRNHPNWKGGRILRVDGYVLIYCPNHRLANNNGYVLEHQLVYENFRKLSPLDWSHVHHIDRNRQNNDISNLEGMTEEMHLSIHHPIELEYRETCKQCGSKHIISGRGNK